jgi:hypothetical protein
MYMVVKEKEEKVSIYTCNYIRIWYILYSYGVRRTYFRRLQLDHRKTTDFVSLFPYHRSVRDDDFVADATVIRPITRAPLIGRKITEFVILPLPTRYTCAQ